ncbi:MAG: hypothetical protein LBK94_11990 [Prevotellaceae bacterium]|jgi:hypothetical protein|nr:hypothetical protein [Prevotellaceae bacterium]
MKKKFFMMAFVSLFAVAALCSCSKDDENENETGAIQNIITAAVENGASYSEIIDTVKAEVEDYYGSDAIIARAPYTNGGFTLTLPASLSAQYLSAADYIPQGITVSNPNVKGGSVGLYAYKSGFEAGEFYYGTNNCMGQLIYVDGDVIITGSSTVTYGATFTIKINVHLKEGWNMVYAKLTPKANDSYETELTIKVPAGAKWHFDSDYSLSEFSLYTQFPSLLRGNFVSGN